MKYLMADTIEVIFLNCQEYVAYNWDSEKREVFESKEDNEDTVELVLSWYEEATPFKIEEIEDITECQELIDYIKNL